MLLLVTAKKEKQYWRAGIPKPNMTGLKKFINPKTGQPQYGNPDMTKVIEAAKGKHTGPTTIEGKTNVVLSHDGFSAGGQYSKLLPQIRKCKFCPLGVKKLKYEANNRFVTTESFPICKFYMAPETRNGTKCVLDVSDFLRRIQTWYDVSKRDPIAFQQKLITQVIADAEVNREVDMLTEGKPGIMAMKNMELALKYTDSMNKPQIGVNVNVDASSSFGKKMLDEAFGRQPEPVMKKVNKDGEIENESDTTKV